MNRRENQNQKILKLLQDGYSINTFTALNQFGITRLSARIWDLRAAGYDIRSKMVTVHPADEDGECYQFKEYWLATEEYKERRQ